MPTSVTTPSNPELFAVPLASIDGNLIKTESSILYSFSGISIPTNATFFGAELSVHGALEGSPSDFPDVHNFFSISLDGGSTFGDNITPDGTFSNSSGSPNSITYGSQDETWGLSLDAWQDAVPALASKLALKYTHPSGNVGYYDFKQLTIHYALAPPGPIQLISGRVQLINGRISI